MDGSWHAGSSETVPIIDVDRRAIDWRLLDKSDAYHRPTFSSIKPVAFWIQLMIVAWRWLPPSGRRPDSAYTFERRSLTGGLQPR